MAGISSWHGTHHVAQKLSTTTFPLREERLTFAPFSEGSVKSADMMAEEGMSKPAALNRASTGEAAAPVAAACGDSDAGASWAEPGAAAAGAAAFAAGAAPRGAHAATASAIRAAANAERAGRI